MVKILIDGSGCTIRTRRETEDIAYELVKRVGAMIVTKLTPCVGYDAFLGAKRANGKVVCVVPWLKPSPWDYIDDCRQYANAEIIAIDEREINPNSQLISWAFRAGQMADVIVIIEVRARRTPKGVRCDAGVCYYTRFAKLGWKPVLIHEPLIDDEEVVNGYRHFVENGAIPFSSIDDLINKINEVMKSSSHQRRGTRRHPSQQSSST